MTTTLSAATLERAGATLAAADFTDPRIRELIRRKMVYTRSDDQ
jgi:hypothetical protein